MIVHASPLQTVKPAQWHNFSVNISQRNTLSLIPCTSVNGSVTKEFKDRLPSVPRKCSRRAFAPYISSCSCNRTPCFCQTKVHKTQSDGTWCDMKRLNMTAWLRVARIVLPSTVAPTLWTPLVVHHSELLFGDRWFLSKSEPRVYPPPGRDAMLHA